MSDRLGSDSDDDDVQIITPSKQKRRLIQDDDETNSLVLSQQSDDEVFIPSGSKKQKRTVVLSDSDDNEQSDDESSEGGRQQNVRTTRRASRRISDLGRQREQELSELKQKLKSKTLDTCLPRTQQVDQADDDFVGESDEEKEDEDDNFLANDDEVEYMDDDEVGVISVDVDDDEEEEDEVRYEYRGSREPLDWFRVYFLYLEHCLLDPEFELDHGEKEFEEAVSHVERGLLQRRDSLRGLVNWPEDLVESINLYPKVHQLEAERSQNCYACNRSGHQASVAISFSGVRCAAGDLYHRGWARHLFNSLEAQEKEHDEFDLGSTCYIRVLLYWSLHQAKRQWCAIIWSKLNEYSNKIPTEEREKFMKMEFSRQKKLLKMVDNLETKDGQSRVANVWLNVPTMDLDVSKNSKRRRGDMNRFIHTVHDQEDEDDDDSDDNDNGGDGDEDGKDDEEDESEKEAKVCKETEKQLSTRNEMKEKKLCLVCNKRGRTGGVLHGYYVHVYCCFECAKHLKEEKKPCAVCSRPMERIIHLLSLNEEEENFIRSSFQS